MNPLSLGRENLRRKEEQVSSGGREEGGGEKKKFSPFPEVGEKHL